MTHPFSLSYTTTFIPRTLMANSMPSSLGGEGLRFLGDAQLGRPQSQLLGVGAGGITTGDEGELTRSDGCEGILDGGGGLDTGGISGGAAQHIVVVDEAGALGSKAVNHTGEAVGDEGSSWLLEWTRIRSALPILALLMDLPVPAE